MGHSRDNSFHRFRSLYEKGSGPAVGGTIRPKPNLNNRAALESRRRQ